MNYIQYMQEGGLPVKIVQPDQVLFPIKGYLIRDDYDKVKQDLSQAYEAVRLFINNFKKGKSVDTKATSSPVVGIENGFGYYGDSFPSTANDNYIRTDTKDTNKPLPYWIQFRS